MSSRHEDRAYRRSRTGRPSPHHEAGGSDGRSDWDPNSHRPRRAVYIEPSPADHDIGPVTDWRRIPISQLLIQDFTQLFFVAGFSVWTDDAGSLRLRDADGILRTQLPTPRSFNERRAAPTIFNEVEFRRISICTATCQELRALLMESAICVCENSTGDLYLRGPTGRVLGVLRRP